MFNLLKSIFIFLGLLQFISCHPLSSIHMPESQANSSQNFYGKFTHKVKYRGETLGKISSWYTGSAKNWRNILKANPGLKPEKIKIGDKIVIPKNLLKKKTPFKKNYVSSKTSKAKSIKPSSSKPALKPKPEVLNSEVVKPKKVEETKPNRNVSKSPYVVEEDEETTYDEVEFVDEDEQVEDVVVEETKDVKAEVKTEKQKLLNELLGQ